MKISKLIIPAVVTIMSGCGIYGAKQFNPDVAATDLSVPLAEQFKNYFYFVQLNDFLDKNGINKNNYYYYPEETKSYSEMKAFTNGSISLMDLELWSKIALNRCAKHGGQLFDSAFSSNSLNIFCIKNDLPIFYIKINEGYNADMYVGQNKGTNGVWGTAAETIDINSSDWLAKAKTEGWSSNYKDKLNSAKQNYISKQKEKLKAVQDSYDKVKSSPVGTMICKNGSNSGLETLSIGYIEDKKGNKLKISIARKFYPSLNAADSGFTPVTIWDNPEEWYLCNYNID